MKLKLAMTTAVVLSATWALAQGVNLTGTWKAKTVSARGSSEQTMELKQTGNTFTGEMTNAQGVKEAIKDGKVSGSDISFNISRKQASGDMADVAYKGTVKGNEITGTFTGASGATVNWTATKQGAGGGLSDMPGM
jgi:hypothetical protein